MTTMNNKEIEEACDLLAQAIQNPKDGGEQAKVQTIRLVTNFLQNMNDIAYYLGELHSIERNRG